MRILLTCDAVGGVWTYTLCLAYALKRLGVTCSLLSIGPLPHQRDIAYMREERIPIDCFEGPLEWTAANKDDLRTSAEAIMDCASKRGARSIHLHSPAFAAFNLGYPVVAVNRSCVKTWWQAMRNASLPPDLEWRSDLNKQGMLVCDHVVAPSKNYASMIRDVYDIPYAPIAIYNGIPSQREHAAEPAGSFIFAAGRLWDQAKNFEALDAIAALMKERIYVAGPLRSPLGDMLSFLNLEHVGNLNSSKLQSIFSRRPVFIAPARFEPFGLTVLEAASYGCPLVLNDIPTLRELWDGAAEFVNMHEPKEVAAQLQCLRDDNGRCEILGMKARERSKRYSIGACANAVRSLHHDLQCGAVS